MHKIWKSLRVPEKTHSTYKLVADRLGIDIYKLLEELGVQLMDIFGEFKKGKANVFYDARGNQLIITVYGKSKMVGGSTFSDEERKRQISEQFKMRDQE